MSDTKSRIKKIFAIALRLFVMAATVFSFYSLRLILLFAGIVLLFVDILRSVSPRKYKTALIMLDCAIVLWLLSMYWLYMPIENIRFQLMNRTYEAAVEELLPVLYTADDTSWSAHKIKTVLPLSVNNEIAYRKYDNSIAIYFSTFQSFFSNAGFIYFSDDTARDFFENPSKHDNSLADSSSYDYIVEYNPNWSYIKLY